MGREMTNTSNTQIARTRCQVNHPKITISSVKESASCSHGWLRWTVQCIFGCITIASFVLIVYMAMSNNTSRWREYRCTSYGCRVVCYGVPYFDAYVQDLNNAIRQVEADCPNIIVVLNDPMFSNYTIPRDFISNLRSNIHELDIVGGNMKFIAPYTFMTPSASSIEKLYFEGVTIGNWVPESFIGLSNLQELYIEQCYINNIKQNALQAVDNTLTTLSIQNSILLVDPLCYFPPYFRDLSFSVLGMDCGNDTQRNKGYEPNHENGLDAILTGKCNTDQGQKREAVVSPSSFLSCSPAQFKSARHALNLPPPFSVGSLKPTIKKLIRAKFAMQSNELSMIEITTEESPANGNYGLLWYQADCPDEMYCVSTFPTNMRVYNVENNVEFTFCPIVLRTGEIVSDQCIHHTFETTEEMTVRKMLQIMLYVCTGVFGTLVGACIIYTVIRKFPSLLKGSDRILFVKHKNVEALVLPPKVPLRASTSTDTKFTNGDINDAIFIVPERKNAYNSFVRMKSTRSDRSSAPSYISAMQPTEEQLAEWRLRHHFDNNLTITSVSFDVPYSLLFDNEAMYSSIGQTSADTNYESLKNDKTQ
ncbi:hypothetical protein NE865_15193 [Phthorimaea operculella]|nr:hypothetical protein NE865_15193 [Phthorimaea operculella]